MKKAFALAMTAGLTTLGAQAANLDTPREKIVTATRNGTVVTLASEYFVCTKDRYLVGFNTKHFYEISTKKAEELDGIAAAGRLGPLEDLKQVYEETLSASEGKVIRDVAASRTAERFKNAFMTDLIYSDLNDEERQELEARYPIEKIEIDNQISYQIMDGALRSTLGDDVREAVGDSTTMGMSATPAWECMKKPELKQ